MQTCSGVGSTSKLSRMIGSQKGFMVCHYNAEKFRVIPPVFLLHLHDPIPRKLGALLQAAAACETQNWGVSIPQLLISAPIVPSSPPSLWIVHGFVHFHCVEIGKRRRQRMTKRKQDHEMDAYIHTGVCVY